MAALYKSNGDRITKAAFPATTVSGGAVPMSLDEDVYERSPAGLDYKTDAAANGGGVLKLFAKAGTVLTQDQIDRLFPSGNAATISPATGPAAGGTVVTISGSNLDGVTGVTFGGTAGTAFSVVDRNTVRVTTPAKAAGAYDVVLADDGGNITKTNGFTYV